MFTQKQLESFSVLIDGRYGIEGVTQALSLCVEMLFYVEEGAFSRRDIQGVVCVLRDITGILEHRSLKK